MADTYNGLTTHEYVRSTLNKVCAKCRENFVRQRIQSRSTMVSPREDKTNNFEIILLPQQVRIKSLVIKFFKRRLARRKSN